MEAGRFEQIELPVRERAAAEEFSSQLLPALGFSEEAGAEECYAVPFEDPSGNQLAICCRQCRPS